MQGHSVSPVKYQARPGKRAEPANKPRLDIHASFEGAPDSVKLSSEDSLPGDEARRCCQRDQPGDKQTRQPPRMSAAHRKPPAWRVERGVDAIHRSRRRGHKQQRASAIDQSQDADQRRRVSAAPATTTTTPARHISIRAPVCAPAARQPSWSADNPGSNHRSNGWEFVRNVRRNECPPKHRR